MSKLEFDKVGTRKFETGAKKGVFFVQSSDGTYPKGVVFDGLRKVSLKPTGGEITSLYADDIKYLNLQAVEGLDGTIEAFYSPEEFDECDGMAKPAKGVVIGQQTRKSFGFCFVTTVGNDTVQNDFGYKIELLYGCLATPSQRDRNTINENPEAANLSWNFKTTPVPVKGFKPTSYLAVESWNTDPAKLAALEDIIYGTESTESRLPLPDEIIDLVGAAAIGA